jgi:hypothetical protein
MQLFTSDGRAQAASLGMPSDCPLRGFSHKPSRNQDHISNPVLRVVILTNMSITTDYRHSLRPNVPIFAGWHMSYNGNTAGYRHNLF